MQNVYSIATRPAYFKTLLSEDPVAYDMRYQARPGMTLPILLDRADGHKLVNATWGLHLPGYKKSVSCLHMKCLFKDRRFTHLLRKQRCAVPANCFFVAKQGTRLVRLLHNRTFCMGGVYQIERTTARTQLRFALLRTEPADMLTPYCDSMPICFATDHWQAWNTHEQLSDVMDYADRASQLWYDHFPVADGVLDATVNSRDLLKPIGLTQQQIKERQAALDQVEVHAPRMNSGGKH